MKRKIIELGNNCMVMSLPIKWVKKNLLKKGAELGVEESSGKLIISPGYTAPVPRKIDLDISNQSKTVIRNEIVGAYQLGYDKIIVSFKKDKEYEMIRFIVDNLLLGFDITEKNDRDVVIESVTEPSEEKQRIILRRLFLTTLETFDIVINDFKERSFKNLKLVSELKIKFESYHNFCQRNLTKQRFISEKINFHSTLYQLLLAIESDLFHLYEYLDKNHPKDFVKAIEAAERVKELYRMTYEAYFSDSLALTRKASDQSLKLRYDFLDKAIAEAGDKESVVLHYLSEVTWITSFISRHIIVFFRL